MNNKEAFLILSRTGTLPSNVIALFTRKKYSHVSISFDKTLNQMYSFGRLNPEKMLPAGFIEESIYDGVFAMFPKSKCLVYKLNITEEQYNNLQIEIHKFIQNQPKYKYSVKGAILAYSNKPYKKDYYYFCSQFVSEILINSGIFKTDKLPELIKPMDLLDIDNKTFIYEGFANEEAALEEENNFLIYSWISKRLLKFRS